VDWSFTAERGRRGSILILSAGAAMSRPPPARRGKPGKFRYFPAETGRDGLASGSRRSVRAAAGVLMQEVPEGFDLAALLAPIAAEAPAGTDLRQDYTPDSLYYRLRDARAEARAA
jgi:hypothetical protein